MELRELPDFAEDAPSVVVKYPVLGPVALRDLRGRALTAAEWAGLYGMHAPCIVRLEDAKAAKTVPDVVHFFRPWRWEGVASTLLEPDEPWFRYAAGAMGPAAPAGAPDGGPPARDGDAVFLTDELREQLTVPFSSGTIRYDDFCACQALTA
jgi:hypothetical protein